jgi:putative ABC transport system permease protein
VQSSFDKSLRRFITLSLLSQAGPVRSAVALVDQRQPVFTMQTMKEKLSLEGSPRRAMAIMVGVFALVAMLLATVGTYGDMAYSVSERTSEIGIRMALGAQPGDALISILKRGIWLLLIGLSLGLGGAIALSEILQSQLFAVTVGDPISRFGVALILAGMAIAACYVPARRAAKIDPMVALRCE